jgi:hypothetical protein
VRAWIALLAFAAAGCDAYDRDIGPAPYFCAATEPRCPIDYTCKDDDNTGEEICVGSDSATSSVDCDDDSAIEPNDVLGDATDSSLDAMSSYQRGGLAICPPSDRDTFSITLTQATRIEVEVAYEQGAPLAAAILNEGGVAIGTTTVDEAARIVRATAQTLRPGGYYAQVAAPGGRANNYVITIRTQ